MPKIIFRKMSLEENINNIKWMYFSDDSALNFRTAVINYFPDLNDINDSLSIEEKNKKIEDLIIECYEYSEKKLIEEAKRYNEVWKKYNDAYFNVLSKYLNIDWPKDKEIVIANVGLIPIFPRYLDSFSFDLSHGLEEMKIIEVAAHETLHFLWFEKWKQIYPDWTREEFDYPHIVWEYSEMVTAPILNSKEINKVLQIVEKSYDYFYEIDGLMAGLNNIYSSNKRIEEKMREGFEFSKLFRK